MEIEDKVMVFDTDDEITNYFLSSQPTVYFDDKLKMGFYDYDLNDMYADAIKNGFTFRVLEPNSKVMKRKCLTRGLISKPIDNLCKVC